MRLPIIVNEHGDVQVFESVNDAETALEAIDVRNDEYVAYDADGQRLLVSVVEENDHVQISYEEDRGNGREELKKILSVFLVRTGHPDEVKEMSLQQLIDKYVNEYGFAR